MIVFHADLDNTLIYSYKRDIGGRKRCVEIYQGREISFVTDRTYQLLKQAEKQVILVPTTTRTMEQYNRIDLGLGTPRYALACNGGVLLVNGKEDLDWYRESLNLTENCKEALRKGMQVLEKDKFRSFEVRSIRELFLFSKSSRPENTVKCLKEQLDTELVDVFHNGVKVYVVPGKLSKGMAVKRFRKRVHAEYVMAAGDSEFDISMLNEADCGIAPEMLRENEQISLGVVFLKEHPVFSEGVLEYVLRHQYAARRGGEGGCEDDRHSAG